MLENSGRPLWLKDRIRNIGHLSNDQCAAFVRALITRSPSLPRAVVLAHISRQCNTRELALACTEGALRAGGIGGVHVLPSFPWQPNQLVSA
jgi:phosphoribosyl 1,2-cyclic phosphodiesterase